MLDMRQELRKHGCKVTPQRTLILDILEQSDCRLTVEEIAKRARERQPNLSLGTVYRNLNILCDINLVVSTWQNRKRSYELNKGHCHRLVCTSCGKMEDLPVCPVNQELLNQARAFGFEIQDHKFELTGFCRSCRSGGRT